MAGHPCSPWRARRLAVAALALLFLACDADHSAPAPAPPPSASSASSERPDPGPWAYGQPCVVTSDRPSEVVYRDLPESAGSIVALNNSVYITTDEGIVRENGELFIPTQQSPGYLTASNGYLYWTQSTKSGGYTLHASLGEFNTEHQIGYSSNPDTRLVAARGGVTITPQVQALSIWSATRPREDIENCPVEQGNVILTVASNDRDILWRNSDHFCASIENNGPAKIILSQDAVGIAMDNNHVFWSERRSNIEPSHIYRRPIHGVKPTLIATSGPVGSRLVMNGDSVFWSTFWGQLERAPKLSDNNKEREILACDVYSYTVAKDYVYWTTPTNPTGGHRTLMKMQRQLTPYFRK